MIGVLILVCAGLVTAAQLKRSSPAGAITATSQLAAKEPRATPIAIQTKSPDDPPNPKSKPDKKGKGKTAPDGTNQKKSDAERFPRRMLVISINNYLFANPILFGSAKRSPAALLERLGETWKIPRDQLFFVTDVKNNRSTSVPIKSVIETVVKSYLETSRPQDRVTLVFAGHCTVIEGKTYLVPLEGELTRAESLIPLSWLIRELESCKARQKLVVLDTCRLDPGRIIRPSPGPMAPEMEAELDSAADGIQFWTSCSQGQYSYEYPYQNVSGRDTEGSVFLNSIFHALLQGSKSKPEPRGPLPVDELSDRVASFTSDTVMAIENTKQTPRVWGKPTVNGADYDPSAAPAERIKIPKPSEIVKGGLADPKLVKSIFDEIRCPPIRSTFFNGELADDTLETAFPFSGTTLSDYRADYSSVQELLEHPDKYPFRVGILKAVEVMERHGRGEVMVGTSQKKVGLLREEYAGPSNDAAKKAILKEQHDGPAAMYLELEDSVRALEKLAEIKSSEKSRRWLAHYDYILALTKARFAYINEYNFVLGKIRKDELPPIDPKIHKGWRLAATEKMSSPKEIKEQADDAHQLFDQIIRNYPGTPWELLAKRDRLTALGLSWQPAALKGK